MFVFQFRTSTESSYYEGSYERSYEGSYYEGSYEGSYESSSERNRGRLSVSLLRETRSSSAAGSLADRRGPSSDN